jgi:hypothetical protein
LNDYTVVSHYNSSSVHSDSWFKPEYATNSKNKHKDTGKKTHWGLGSHHPKHQVFALNQHTLVSSYSRVQTRDYSSQKPAQSHTAKVESMGTW